MFFTKKVLAEKLEESQNARELLVQQLTDCTEKLNKAREEVLELKAEVSRLQREAEKKADSAEKPSVEEQLENMLNYNGEVQAWK